MRIKIIGLILETFLFLRGGGCRGVSLPPPPPLPTRISRGVSLPPPWLFLVLSASKKEECSDSKIRGMA